MRGRGRLRSPFSCAVRGRGAPRFIVPSLSHRFFQLPTLFLPPFPRTLNSPQQNLWADSGSGRRPSVLTPSVDHDTGMWEKISHIVAICDKLLTSS
jgi:hypothetical protein